MIAQTKILLWSKGSCTPVYRNHTSIGGPTVPLQQPKSNKGKRWTWAGTPPHPTRMHAYASLTSGQKDAWKATADLMTNQHTAELSPLPYSGPIAYQLVNKWRRLQGLPYTDDAPAGDAAPSEIAAVLGTDGGPPGQVLGELTT
jgi:hypothetical protein